MKNERPELFRLVISLVVLGMAGYLWVVSATAQGMAGIMIGSVIHWWFPQGKNGNGHGPTNGGA